MAAQHRYWSSMAGALVLAIAQAQFAAAAPAPPPAATAAARPLDNSELLIRLQRLERDMRDLEAATFRKPPGDKVVAPKDTDLPVTAAEPPPPPVMPDLNPLLRRIDELEEGLGRLTGQMEELGHQVDQLSQKADRLQKQFDLQVAEQVKKETASPTAPANNEKPADEVASLNTGK